MIERRLYIGAPVRCAGWEVYSDAEHTDVDYVGRIDRLDGVSDSSYTILYANAIGRLNYTTQAVRAMRSWYRVLSSGGVLIVVGVDAKAIGNALSAGVPFEDQFALSMLMNKQVCWTTEVLASYLQLAGFSNVRQVDSPKLFNDVCELKMGDKRLGLSIFAERK